MKAKESFTIKLDVNGETNVFNGKVLYWWEEQNIKTDSIYEEKATQKLVLDNSKIYRYTVNKFLESAQDNDKKMDKNDLLRLSLEKNKNIEWSDVLHFSVIIPLYEAYLDVSGSSTKKIKEFRKKVLAVYDRNLLMEDVSDFPEPAELIEYKFLSVNGVITRSDLLHMSYAELLKYKVIRDIDKRYKQEKAVTHINDLEYIMKNQPGQIIGEEQAG